MPKIVTRECQSGESGAVEAFGGLTSGFIISFCRCRLLRSDRIQPVSCLPSLKLIAKAPENVWLEYDPFLLGSRPIFRGGLTLVSGRVTHTIFLPVTFFEPYHYRI